LNGFIEDLVERKQDKDRIKQVRKSLTLLSEVLSKKKTAKSKAKPAAQAKMKPAAQAKVKAPGPQIVIAPNVNKPNPKPKTW